jgi:hypothetical protein
VKPVLFILATCFIYGCDNNGNVATTTTGDSATTSIQQDSSSHIVYNFTDTAMYNRITDTLLQLPFVKTSNHYIDSLTGHKKGISFITDTLQNEITVMAGYDGAERFETYYNFSIDRKTFEIKVMDAASGEYLTIADYIKKNKDTN